MAVTFSACEKEGLESDINQKTPQKKTTLTEKGRFDNKPFEWDYTCMPFLLPNEVFIGTLSFPHDIAPQQTTRSGENRSGRSSGSHRTSSGNRGGTTTNTSEYEAGLIVQNPTGVYVGAVYPFSSIESGLFDKEVVNLKKNPIRMLFKFPMDYRFQMTNTKDEWEYSEGLEQALNSDKYRDHVSSLNEGSKEEVGYSITEYSSLSDVEKAFGANVKLGSIFTSKIQLNSKNVNAKGRMLAYLVGKNFKVSMVTPPNGFFVNESDNKRDNLTYLRALSYGKLAFVSIESSYSYEEVKKAFEVGIKYKFIDAGANYDEKTKNIFASSRITIMAIGDNTKETFYMNSAENLSSIFSTSYTKFAYGKPIFVEMNKVFDGSAFIPGVSSDGGRRQSGGNRTNTPTNGKRDGGTTSDTGRNSGRTSGGRR
ncbi:MAG: hypothetical protein Q4G63_02365 [Bacteroidia bacterium]|nr:hypothetical protein [Bacteroidia bacterium]